MKRLVVVASALLDGCTTIYMNRYVPPLVGQNVQVAVGKLGAAYTESPAVSDVEYTWSKGTGGIPLLYGCRVQLAVGPDAVIKSAAWHGDNWGCGEYARRLAGKWK